MSSHLDPALLTSFSIGRVAELWGTSHDIIKTHIESGELRAYDASAGRGKKKCWRITAAALLDFQRRRSNQAPEPPAPPRRSRQKKTTTQYV